MRSTPRIRPLTQPTGAGPHKGAATVYRTSCSRQWGQARPCRPVGFLSLRRQFALCLEQLGLARLRFSNSSLSGTVLMPSRYVAFFSYTHADDEHDEGLLSSVRARLESELRLALGDRDVQIFQDRDDLNPGDVWEARLAKALDEAVYLIPVITPSFFASEFCRKEFMRFWRHRPIPTARASFRSTGAPTFRSMVCCRQLPTSCWRRPRLFNTTTGARCVNSGSPTGARDRRLRPWPSIWPCATPGIRRSQECLHRVHPSLIRKP